jgi:hypothetical protein
MRMGAAIDELQQRMLDAGLKLGQVTFADALPAEDEAGLRAAAVETSTGTVSS